jgi:hypothetical protein
MHRVLSKTQKTDSFLNESRLLGGRTKAIKTTISRSIFRNVV